MAATRSFICEPTQACAHASSFRDSSRCGSTSLPSSSPSPSPSPSPSSLQSPSSIYVTFKVLQLVNGFRKRLARKLAAQATSKKPSARRPSVSDICSDLNDYEAAVEIDKYLGRSGQHRLGNPRRGTPGLECCNKGTRHTDKPIEHLLRKLSQSVTFGQYSIETLAKDDRKFLEQQSSLSIRQLGVPQLCEVLVAVKELIASLEDPDSVDDTYLANLIHLLLRIQGSLVRLLVSRLLRLIRQQVSDCQRDQSKHLKNWFFEFPDARHPLSTTFPWTVKASLVVLWGVCWMFEAQAVAPAFFDEEYNLVNERGEVEVPAQAVIAFLHSTQGQPQQQGLQPMQAAAIAPRQALSAQQWPYGGPSSAMAQPRRRGGLTRTSNSHSLQPHPDHRTIPDQAADTVSTSGFAHYSNPPAHPSPQAPSAWQVPQEATWDFGPAASWNPHQGGVPLSYPAAHAAPTTTAAHPPFASPAHFQTRPIGHRASLPPTRHPRHPNPPAITTTDLSPFPFPPQQQPEDLYSYSATSVSSNSSLPLPDQAAVSHLRYSHFDPSHLSPNSPVPYMADALGEARDMQTTTPPRSPQDLQLSEPMNRKRSHSQMSTGLPFPQLDDNHHPQINGSHQGSQVGDDVFETGRTAVERPEPMMNDQRKYICNIGGDDCGHLTFDRKCEWSKHMDKHDRPYRCPDPGCAKLQGFTYSGGLLRHEREVHNKHGGPKSQMMCPFPDCKRHTGKGFTRKENLNEHIRRVHNGAERPTAPPPQPSVMKSDDDPFAEALAGATRAMDGSDDTPASRASENGMIDTELQSPASKRRRHGQHGHSNGSSEEVEELRRHIEHLQQENAQKDQRLLDMERMLAEMDRRLQEHQQAQSGWHDQQQAAAAVAAMASATQQT